MKLDIDHIVGEILEWDFTVIIGHVEYATRAPRLGEWQLLLKLKDERHSLDKIIGFVQTLFPIAPPRGFWADDPEAGEFRLAAFLNGYASYLSEISKKKAALAAQVGEQARAKVAEAFGN